MSIWYSRRKKEGKSLRLAAVGKSAFCFAELHYDVRSAYCMQQALRQRKRCASLAEWSAKSKETTEKGRKEFPFGFF